MKLLLCKDPLKRPDMESILRVPYVRKHIGEYAQHVKSAVKRRRDSLKSSLEEYVDASEVSKTIYNTMLFKLSWLLLNP